ncbi:MAG: PD-(D/E)XK nuclease family protein [Patescibacteria group bacterium]
MRTSYSALDTYKTCPLKYKYQEIDRIRVPKSKEAVFGTIIHGALKFMFKRDPLYPALDEVINFFGEKWQEQKKEKVEWSEEEQDAYYQDGLDLLKKFYAKNQPWNFNVVDLETRFEMPLETHILTGIIDRIDKPDEDTYEIIDYKTARRMPSQEALDQNLQMSIYHLGLIRRWPHLENRKIKLSLYFLKHGEKISTIRDEQSLQETKRSVLSLIKEIEKRNENKDFPPTPGPLCDWCGYKPICPIWMHLYQKDKTEPDESKIQEIIKEYFELKEKSRKDAVRIKEIQTAFFDYMRQKNVLRLFSNDGYVSKTTKISVKYDLKKVRAVLEPLGRWSEILKADEKKITDLLPALPPDAQEKIKAASVVKTGEILTVSRGRFRKIS